MLFIFLLNHHEVSQETDYKSREILMFVCLQDFTLTSQETDYKPHEILMFVCLQKDAKQCCESQRSITLIVLVFD